MENLEELHRLHQCLKNDAHDQYFALCDGKGRTVFSSQGENYRYALAKNGQAAFRWNNETIDFLLPTNITTEASRILSINKIANATLYPIKQKFGVHIKFTEVLLMSNCTDISVTVVSTTYNKDTLIDVVIPANTEFTINDITIAAGELSADANIKFIEL